MTKTYWPLSGPSQLGKAMWWISFAHSKKFMEDRGASFDVVYRTLKPFIDYEAMWPIAYFCTEEEAEAFRKAR